MADPRFFQRTGSQSIAALCSGLPVEYPDQSATCVVDVTAWQATQPQDAGAVCLRGPGVRDLLSLHIDGLGVDFVRQHHAMQLHAPCGVDVYCCTHDALLGLPRSVHISLAGDVKGPACM